MYTLYMFLSFRSNFAHQWLIVSSNVFEEQIFAGLSPGPEATVLFNIKNDNFRKETIDLLFFLYDQQFLFLKFTHKLHVHVQKYSIFFVWQFRTQKWIWLIISERNVWWLRKAKLMNKNRSYLLYCTFENIDCADPKSQTQNSEPLWKQTNNIACMKMFYIVTIPSASLCILSYLFYY